MSQSSREGNRKGLYFALSITSIIMVVEFFGGMFSNSLALLSDSGHMLSDALSLVLTILAIWFASRPATNEKTYGYHRLEIFAASINSIILLVGSGIIIYHAIVRLISPQMVTNFTMIIIGCFGLAANLASAYFMSKNSDVENNLNMKGAYLHVLADAATSIGVIVSGILISLFNWTYADPIMSIITAIIFTKSAIEILKNSFHIFMQGTPEHIVRADVADALFEIDGVQDVHDLHIWTISPGNDTLSCHLLVDENEDQDKVLRQAVDHIHHRFQIRKVTIQVEKHNYGK